MLITCPECENKVSKSAEVCPKCGFPDPYQGCKEACEEFIQALGKHINTWEDCRYFPSKLYDENHFSQACSCFSNTDRGLAFQNTYGFINEVIGTVMSCQIKRHITRYYVLFYVRCDSCNKEIPRIWTTIDHCDE